MNRKMPRNSPMLLAIALLVLLLVERACQASIDSSQVFLPPTAPSVCAPLADQASSLVGLPAEACAIVAHMLSQRCLCHGERTKGSVEATELVAEAVEMCTGLQQLVPACADVNDLASGDAEQPSRLTLRLRGDGSITLRRSADPASNTITHTTVTHPDPDDADGEPRQFIATTTTTTITSAHVIRRTTVFSAPSFSSFLFRLFGTPRLPDLPLPLHPPHPATTPAADPLSDIPQLQIHTDNPLGAMPLDPTPSADDSALEVTDSALEGTDALPQMQLAPDGTFTQAPPQDTIPSLPSATVDPLLPDPDRLLPDSDILSADPSRATAAHPATLSTTRTSGRMDHITLHCITHTTWLTSHPLRRLLVCFLSGLAICFAVAGAARQALLHHRRQQRHRQLAQPLLPPAGGTAPPLHVLMAKGHRPSLAEPVK